MVNSIHVLTSVLSLLVDFQFLWDVTFCLMLLEVILPSFSVPKTKVRHFVFSAASDDHPRYNGGESALVLVVCFC